MANHPLADKVKHLSVRIDDDDMQRIDKIRTALGKQSNGITPQRSQVLRRVISIGIETYGEQLSIDTSVKKAAEASKSGKKAKA